MPFYRFRNETSFGQNKNASINIIVEICTECKMYSAQPKINIQVHLMRTRASVCFPYVAKFIHPLFTTFNTRVRHNKVYYFVVFVSIFSTKPCARNLCAYCIWSYRRRGEERREANKTETKSPAACEEYRTSTGKKIRNNVQLFYSN